MGGCGRQLGVSNSPRSAGRSRAFILGLILTCYTTNVQTGDCQNISSIYQQCRTDPAGVRDLDCFAKGSHMKTQCVWKPGKHTAKKTYTLLIQQQKYCNVYENITQHQRSIEINPNKNMSAEILEHTETTNCTKAVFRGSANSWMRCGPPTNASFRRRAGKLCEDVSWSKDDKKNIKSYLVRYKTQDSRAWNESSVLQQNGPSCLVENLNSALVYQVQIRCNTDDKCSQCPWSQTYTVPAELTARPEIDSIKEDVVGKEGRRLVVIKWKFSARDMYDNYSVTIQKPSGEPTGDVLSTRKPKIRLVLSYSAFTISITAVNNASTSPAVNMTIPQREGTRDDRLNVTVNSNRFFTLHWKDHLFKAYVCYCVEWSKKGQKVMYKSFYENSKNYKRIDASEQEHLEPYVRYAVTLHTRTNKNTCNMKHVNGSESTYSSTRFYFMEGTPVSAPQNISSFNVTSTSVELQWSSILEEDIRGFLLGYTVHCVEYNQPRGPERNITVDPEYNHFKLEDLKSATAYEVHISGFTKAGVGVRSPPCIFTTAHEGYFNLNLRTILTVFFIVLTLLIIGPTIIKRTKVVLWPSIPNPGNSNTMQKIEKSCELALLESIKTLMVEEWDTHSLQIVEKETVIPATSIQRLRVSDNEDETMNWIQRDTGDAPPGMRTDPAPDAVSNGPHAGLQRAPFAYLSEYTTMEMFNQVMPQHVPVMTDASEPEKSESEDAELTVVKPGLDYIRQFSSSPTLDSELDTFL